MDIMELLTKGGYIIFSKIVAERLGKDAALLFGELCAENMYWIVKDQMKDGYFYSTMGNLKKQAKLSRHQQDVARKKLLKYGLIEIKTDGLHCINYYRINVEKMAQMLLETDNIGCEKLTTGLRKTDNIGCQKLATGLLEINNVGCQKLTTNNNNIINNKNSNRKKNNKKESMGVARANPSPFTPPSLDEINNFLEEEKINCVDSKYFLDYYNSNGWKVGKNPMKDWKATVRNWSRREWSKNQDQIVPADATSGLNKRDKNILEFMQWCQESDDLEKESNTNDN